jgi:hypothetical protein
VSPSINIDNHIITPFHPPSSPLVAGSFSDESPSTEKYPATLREFATENLGSETNFASEA